MPVIESLWDRVISAQVISYQVDDDFLTILKNIRRVDISLYGRIKKVLGNF